MTTLDILALGAHPDDAELGVGGLLALAARQGLATGIVDLTAGELSSKGSVALRAEEAAEAARRLGLATRHQLGLPDGDIVDRADSRILLAAYLRRVRPRIVLGPAAVDRHPDHVAASHLTKAAVHLAGLRRAGVDGVPHRVETLLWYPGNDWVNPSIVVDISEVIDQWEAALRAYRSQFTGEAVSEVVSPAGIDSRRARRRVWGSMVGVSYGEGLVSDRPWRARLW